MITAKVGRRGQITLPCAIREQLAVEEGQRVAFVIEGGKVTLYPLNQTLLDLRGIVPVTGPQDFEAIRDTVRRKQAANTALESDDNDARIR